MKSVSISGSPRVNVGKKDAKALRNAENVPCVLYGGKEQIHFYAPYKEFMPLVYTPEVNTVKISINGKEYNALMQEIQFHPVNDKILHVDFLELFPDKHVIIDIPVKITGKSIGVKQGGKLIVGVRKLKVRALPSQLPDYIPVNVDNLDIGQSVKVENISIKEVQLLDAPNKVIVSARITRAVVAPTEATAKAAAPAAGTPTAAAAPAAKEKETKKEGKK